MFSFISKLLSNVKVGNSLQSTYEELCHRSEGLGNNYTKFNQYNFSLDDINLVKNIALYLPQFHVTPENNKWWGRNFTEWTNVVKAIPQYAGQYQPHLPVDFGFYDLLQKETWVQQIEIAQNYGIYGFCYYFYWFQGKRVLDRPVSLFLDTPELKMPFCFFWANDSWVRTWHGFSDYEQGDRVLLEQNHTDEDDENVMKYLCEQVFSDDRYIKINGHPVFIVYHISLFKDIRKTTDSWRESAIRYGFKGLFLVYVMMPDLVDSNPEAWGFDAIMQFSPIACQRDRVNVELLNPNFKGEVYDYKKLVDYEIARSFSTKNVIRGCFPSWDNEARRPGKGISYTNVSPNLFFSYLSRMNNWAKDNPINNQSMVFINAWNEWAEGAHLEPDREYGYGWLDQVARVILQNKG